jgi:hypothetical protein
MVFLVNGNGVPSQGQIVKIDAAADTAAPTAPSGLAATAQTDGAAVSWTAATDNVGVDEYRVYRSTTAGFTPSAANRVARVPSGTSWTDTGRAAGTYHYRVKAIDKAGNLGPASNQATAVVAGDTTAPTVALTAPAAGSVIGPTTISATAADAIGVASVQFRLDGADLGSPDTAAPYSLSWDTTTAPDGLHSLTAVARDASGNATTSAAVAVDVSNTGVVAAYGFDEASGATATDVVSSFNGTISGATRVAAGRYGGALSFDGVNDWVTVPHASALNLSAGMTIEAWVKPSALTSWRGVVAKEQAAALPYALYASTTTDTPGASLVTNSVTRNVAAAPTLGLNTWTHLAMTWDGSVVRLYVDGAEIASGPAPGTLLTSTGNLRIGGNALRGEFFAGLIDEVRIYDRALSATRIGADMNAPVSP